MKVIVTGGAGFIGSNIVDELVRQGHQVKVIDNLSTGRRSNLDRVISQIDFVEGDICDLELLRQEFIGFDYVLHQAALNSAPRSIDNPVATDRNNIEGTLKVLVAARDTRVKRVVYASSSSIYGNISAPLKVETMPPNPASPYALTKYAGEIYCKFFTQLYGLDTICLRYFNVFGPHQNPDSPYSAAIPKFIKALLKGELPTVFGDGAQSRDFTYVDNVVQANLLAMAISRGDGETVNIACGESYTINQVLELIGRQLQTKIAANYLPDRAGDVKYAQADIAKAGQLLGYHPVVLFPQGLHRTVEFYQAQVLVTKESNVTN